LLRFAARRILLCAPGMAQSYATYPFPWPALRHTAAENMHQPMSASDY